MSYGEGGGGNFADSGGYGGNFGGTGGATNRSGTSGGNPTNMSGGVGNYGAIRSAMSRYNGAMASNNPAGAVAGWSRAQRQMNERLGLMPGMGFNNPRASTGGGGRGGTGTAGRVPGTIPETVAPVEEEPVAPVDPEAVEAVKQFLGYTGYLGSKPVPGTFGNPALNALTGVVTSPSKPLSSGTTRSVTPAPQASKIPDRLDEEEENTNFNFGYGGFNPGLNNWGQADWLDPGDWGMGPGAGHIGWNMGNVGQSGKPIGDQVPGRRTGGPVGANKKYVVGENGPETFVPRQSGTIIPNPRDQAMIPPTNTQPLGGMDPALLRQQFEMMRQQHMNRQPPVTTPPAPPQTPMPMSPEMQAWRDARPTQPEGVMTRDMADAFRASIDAWKQGRPHLGGGGGFTRPHPGMNAGHQMPTTPPAPAPAPVPSPTPTGQPGGGQFSGNNLGFGLSGLGQQGLLAQLRQRPGFGGNVG